MNKPIGESEGLSRGNRPMMGQLSSFLRIIPAFYPKEVAILSTVETESSTKTVSLFAAKKKTHRVVVDHVFDENCPNKIVRKRLFALNNPDSVLNWLFKGFNATLITYGEVNSGKTSTLFEESNVEENSFLYVIHQLLGQGRNYRLGVAFWEIVYSQEERAEITVDLLGNTVNHGENPVSIAVEDMEQAKLLYKTAQKMSGNFKFSSDGNVYILNNRSHFFIKITLIDLQTKRASNLTIADLAGVVPINLVSDLRTRLGTEEQVNFTRIGLNQLRSLFYELAKDESDSLLSILSNKNSKLVQSLGPLIGGNCRTFLLFSLRENSVYSEAARLFEFIVKSREIYTPCIPIKSLNDDFRDFQEFQHINRGNTEILDISVPRVSRIQLSLEHFKSSSPENTQIHHYLESSPSRLEEYPTQYDPSLLEDEFPESPRELGVSPLRVSQLDPPEDNLNVYRGEYFVKKNCYDNTLGTLKDQEEAKIEFSERIDEYVYVYEELQHTYGIKVEDVKIDNAWLKQKLNLFQRGLDTSTVFSFYEDEISRLEKKLSCLRQITINTLNSFSNLKASNEFDEQSALNNKAKRSIKELRNSLLNLSKEIAQNEEESFGLKKKEREWFISRKCLESLSGITGQLQSDWSAQKKLISANEEALEEMKEDFWKNRSENEKLKRELQSKIEENNRVSEEIRKVREVTGLNEGVFKRANSNKTGKTVMNLLNRLQKEVAMKYDNTKMIQLVEAMKYEVNDVFSSVSQKQIKERNLLSVLSDIQGKEKRHGRSRMSTGLYGKNSQSYVAS